MDGNSGKSLAAVIIILGTIVTGILMIAISYSLIAAITWAIFWCFGWVWSWQLALGIWLFAIFLKQMHKFITKHGEKK